MKLGDLNLATKHGKKDNRLLEKETLHIAETTHLSPQQSKDLLRKQGKAEGRVSGGCRPLQGAPKRG